MRIGFYYNIFHQSLKIHQIPRIKLLCFYDACMLSRFFDMLMLVRIFHSKFHSSIEMVVLYVKFNGEEGQQVINLNTNFQGRSILLWGWDYGVERQFQQYISYIVTVSFIGRGNQSTRRKPPTCPKSRKTLAHSVVSSTYRHEWDTNS